MKRDLSKLLRDWPYEPGKINARFVEGDDGDPRLQIRLDLGVLQLALDGRPDGVTPFGAPSLLDYFEARIDQAEDDDEGEAFTLSAEDCRALWDEAIQFNHRFVALNALEDFERVFRDTSRNLRVLDIIAQHGSADEDRQALEQFRPYLTMMRTRALAARLLKDNEPAAAALAIDHGLESIQKHFEVTGEPQLFEQASEVQALRGMRDALAVGTPAPARSRKTASPRTELQRQLDVAVKAEDYELAAKLRDKINQLKE